jgi:threonine dehydratase
LRYIAERADLGEHNEAIIAATSDEKPGSFLKFCRIIVNSIFLSDYKDLK